MNSAETVNTVQGVVGNLVPRADLQTSSRSLTQNVSRNPGQEMCDLNLMYQYPFQFELNVLQVVYHFVPHDARREWSVKHVLTIEK